jgi:hypothetical protein
MGEKQCQGRTLASRTLAVLLTVWALVELTYLPGQLNSLLHYVGNAPEPSTSIQYWHHYYLLGLSFLVTRIVSFSLMARWLFRGGPEVMQL